MNEIEPWEQIMDTKSLTVLKENAPTHQPEPKSSICFSQEIEQALRALGGAATVDQLVEQIVGPASDESLRRRTRERVRIELETAYERHEIEREDIAGWGPVWGHSLQGGIQ